MNANILIDSSSGDSQSCSSSFDADANNDEQEEKNGATDEMQKSMVDSESFSDLKRKSLYESRLVQQPLYQIYMMQEQKTLNEDPPPPSQILKPATIVVDAMSGNDEADSVCDSSNDADDMASISVRRQSSTASTDSGKHLEAYSLNLDY